MVLGLMVLGILQFMKVLGFGKLGFRVLGFWCIVV